MASEPINDYRRGQLLFPTSKLVIRQFPKYDYRRRFWNHTFIDRRALPSWHIIYTFYSILDTQAPNIFQWINVSSCFDVFIV